MFNAIGKFYGFELSRQGRLAMVILTALAVMGFIMHCFSFDPALVIFYSFLGGGEEGSLW